MIEINKRKYKIATVIPCYKVKNQILGVINKIPKFVDLIIVVDDFCPEESGKFVKEKIQNKKVKVFFHERNRGVGAATKSGYKIALDLGADIIVKVDGDDQMDTSILGKFLGALMENNYDYIKGNRFHFLSNIKSMPTIRIIGNIILSFFSKLSSGYYSIFDPTNGFTAIKAESLKKINLESVDNRYFFESDMLYHIGLTQGKVRDFPMKAIYGNEKSNLEIPKIIVIFLVKHFRNMIKRIVYEYYVRDFSIASLQLFLSIVLGSWGVVLGSISWARSHANGEPSQPGTIVLVSILLISGLQFFLAFVNYDVNSRNKERY